MKDRSTGQRAEVRVYLEADATTESPVWIINGGRCESLTPEEIGQVTSTAIASGA